MKNLRLKQMVRCCILMTVSTVFALTVSAIPAKPGQTKVITLENGMTVKARLVGDEFGHYWLGEDGKSYQGNEDGSVFRVVDVKQIVKKASAMRQQRDKSNGKRLSQKKVGDFGDYTGKKKGLIILVNYSNVSFKSTNDNALFQRIANEKDFSQGKFVGSIYDYFYAQSGGKFELTFDVVGPLTVSKNQSYYGGNDYYGNDSHPAEMICEACKLADEYVDYKDYDWDGDGNVEQIYVIYAGKGEADGGASNTIWPHQWELSAAASYGDGDGTLTLDGVRIDKYACGGELDGQTGTVNGIGTMCHEFSHCLGFPDFYDTDYSGGYGMDVWDLMCSGSYNGGGYRPCGYTSYERWMAGWLEPTELVYTKNVKNMKALTEGGESYIIYNEGNRDEYFMLENRQLVGWDADLPGKGMLIVHVDYDKYVWASNTPNDTPSHQRMTWMPADGTYNTTGWGQYVSLTEAGLAGDTYPSKTNGNDKFNKDSNPAAKFYNRNADNTYYMSSSVENITQNADGTISFSFVGLNGVSSPEFTPKTGVYSGPVSVTITYDEDAEVYYTIDGTTPTRNSKKYTGAFVLNETSTVSAIAVNETMSSDVVSARYIIRQPSTDITTFRRVANVSELQSGKRYVIACGSKNKAAGAMSSNSLSGNSVDIYDDIVIADNKTTVLTLDIDNGKYALYNDEGNFLTSTSISKLAFESDMNYWDLSNHTSGVIMSFGTYGNMIYYTVQNKFTTSKNTSMQMIYANLYEEYEITDKLNPQLTFDKEEYTVTLGDDFAAPQLTVTPENLAVVYSSSDEAVATVDANTGKMNIIKAGTTVISANFAGNEMYNAATASYKLIVNDPPVKQDVQLMFDKEEYTVTLGDDFAAPQLTTIPEDLAVVYSSSDEGVATVDANTGEVNIFEVGTTVITAMFAGNDSYNPAQTSYTLVVSEPIIIDNIGFVVDGNSETHDNSIYTLDGRKIVGGNLPKGIYIRNGRKYVR